MALVEGKVKKPEGTITSWLKESKTLKMYSSHYPNDGLHAVTHYKVIQSEQQLLPSRGLWRRGEKTKFVFIWRTSVIPSSMIRNTAPSHAPLTGLG